MRLSDFQEAEMLQVAGIRASGRWGGGVVGLSGDCKLSVLETFWGELKEEPKCVPIPSQPRISPELGKGWG